MSRDYLDLEKINRLLLESYFEMKLNPLVPAVVSLLIIALGQEPVLGEDRHDRFYDVDQGILGRVSEALNRVMIRPIEAINIIKTMNRNKGFAPHGLHAGGRDRVMSFLYSLIKSFETVQLYFGTELGEYFTYFSYEGVYREPGNSGYRPDDPIFAKYYPICTDGNTGELHPCSMTEGMEVSPVTHVHIKTQNLLSRAP